MPSHSFIPSFVYMDDGPSNERGRGGDSSAEGGARQLRQWLLVRYRCDHLYNLCCNIPPLALNIA
jgi:hypothetical protein